MRRLRVGGVALGGSGYPNAAETIALLKRNSEWIVYDHAKWLPPETRLWRIAQDPWPRRVGSMIRLALSGCAQALVVAMTTHKDEKVYVPYPAPLTLWWLSFLPRRWRPTCIADAYISIWDSMFRDRGTDSKGSPISKAIRRFEGRSLRAAELVLVDTEANRLQLTGDFGLEPERVRSIPLAIDDRPFSALDGAPAGTNRVRVLFAGTLVPLHGIEVILAAMTRLANDPGIDFRLIGDGQQHALVEEFLEDVNPTNVTWIRHWLSLDELALEVERADICLGVFGGNGKASRVLPFKLYYALAAGRAIITQSEYSLPEGAPPLPAAGVAGTSVEERGDRLAAEIRSLSENVEMRISLAVSARRYFNANLSGDAVLTAWNRIIDGR